MAGNPEIRNIPKGKSENLEVVRLEKRDPEGLFFNIPSEEGWGQREQFERGSSTAGRLQFEKKSRVVLVSKKYEGTLIVGAEDVEPVERHFEMGLKENGQLYLELMA